MRRIMVLMAAVVLVAACGGGDDDGGSGGSGGSGGTSDQSAHEQMCEAIWEQGGQQEAEARGQAKADYMDECVRAMGGGTTTTAAP
jgi:hypothetical protein